MKITVKPKAAPTDVYTIRIPVSLKQQMEATRKLADECDADYNATLIGVLANFNANMQAYLSYKSPMGTMDTNPEKPRDLLRKHPFTAVFTATGKSRLSA
jgi:hypothetical protein